MNYRNYEGKIVEKYGVKLKGWPTNGISNPAAIGGRLQLQKLLAALESGQCHWVVLTDELEERKQNNQAREDRGEQVYQPRKSANRHSNSKGTKSAETIEDDGEEDGDDEPTKKRARDCDDEDEDDEDEQEPARKRTCIEEDGDNNGDNSKSVTTVNTDTTAVNTAVNGDITVNGDNMVNEDNTVSGNITSLATTSI